MVGYRRECEPLYGTALIDLVFSRACGVGRPHPRYGYYGCISQEEVSEANFVTPRLLRMVAELNILDLVAPPQPSQEQPGEGVPGIDSPGVVMPGVAESAAHAPLLTVVSAQSQLVVSATPFLVPGAYASPPVPSPSRTCVGV